MTESTSTRLERSVAHMHEAWGGALCLDFANTLEPRGGPPPLDLPPGFTFRDELTSYDDLVGWAIHKGELEATLGETLLAVADSDTETADAIVARAHALRDGIYRVFWSIANQEQPARDDLAVITGEYAASTAHAELISNESGFSWGWSEAGSDLARPLWSVARSAADLLTIGELHRIKVCPGPGRETVRCGWLFLDTTKNNSRRWCSMSDCGSATKTRNQTARRRAQRTTRA